jgi:hypothetical protein
MCFHISKHVLSEIRYRKTCVSKTDFVLGVDWEEDTSTEIGQNSCGFEGPTVEIEISEVLFIMNQ